MNGPVITIDLEKIENNTRTIVSLCRQYNISISGVTKVTCGMPQVARAMMRGGVSGLGESRLDNIHRLRSSGINCPIMLLRIPPLSRVDEIVMSVDISLNSELDVIRALSESADKRGIIHRIILMVDLGDLREGIWPADLIPFTKEVVDMPGVLIAGVGTNLTCYGGVLPSVDNMKTLVDHAKTIESRFNLKLQYISGGNSSSLPLLMSGKMPKEINHLRIGEAILLGRETAFRNPVPDAALDAFLLDGEIIELKEKPSVPIGETGEDAFGGKPVFKDLGIRKRAILNVGREDVQVEGLSPLDSEITIFGASSDHLLLDVNDAKTPLKVGDKVNFQLNYAALLAAMTSEYVRKKTIREKDTMEKNRHIGLIGPGSMMDLACKTGLDKGLETLKYNVSLHNLLDQTTELVNQEIQSKVDTLLFSKGRPLLMGSDHLSTMAGMQGLCKQLEAFGLIWFDAVSGFAHPEKPSPLPTADSVLTHIFEPQDDYPDNPVTDHLSPENVVLIGLRQADSSEAARIKNLRVKVFTMEDVDLLGIREVMRQALWTAGNGTQGLYVSYNPDVTDSRSGGNTTGGLTYRETHHAMEMIAGSGMLRAMDITGIPISPEEFGQTIGFILSAFGKKILGN